MEVREPDARYLPAVQRTELGEFPADWQVVPLGEFDPFITSGSRGWAAYYADIGTTFLRITNLSRSCIYPSLRDLRYVAVPPNNSEGVRTALRAGDVLISITADIGIVGLVTAAVELPAYINQHIALVRFDGREVNSRYVAYFLAGTAAQRRFKSMTDAGAKAGMNLAGVRDVLAALPNSADEQAAIADALTDADALIDSLEQLLTKRRQIKQGAMQELLTGKRRLPGFTGRWAETTLFDLAGRKKDLFDDGDWIESEHIRNEGIRLIQTGNIGVGRFIEKEDKKYIDDRSFLQLRCKQLQIGDLLICRLADPAGRACVLPNIEEERVVTSVDVTIFRPPSDTASRKFLAQVFSRSQWFKAVDELSGGTTHKRIARGALGRMAITLPSLAEQAAIAEVLSDMDAAITALESRLTKARALKQAMAQALLTGRIRLVGEGAST